MIPPVAPASAADVVDFPMVELRGTPVERGRTYGAALKSQVLGSVALYTAQLRAMNHDWSAIAAIAREFLPLVEGYDPAYVEEMRGIAEEIGTLGQSLMHVASDIPSPRAPWSPDQIADSMEKDRNRLATLASRLLELLPEQSSASSR